jgi:hypothetical protein
MTLHRRIIRPLSSADDPSLRTICRQAAHVRLISAVDFISSLRAEHLQSFWYSASKYNFALVGTFISLLWATSTTKEEADVYRQSLDEYRWILRLSSKSADFLERAIGMLGSSTGVLVRSIPEYPDSERILGRHVRILNHEHTVLSRNSSYGPPMAYLSESETQEEMLPENLMDGKLSDSGVVARDWDVDPAWFGALNAGETDLEVGHSQGDGPNAFLGFSELSSGTHYS